MIVAVRLKIDIQFALIAEPTKKMLIILLLCPLRTRTGMPPSIHAHDISNINRRFGYFLYSIQYIYIYIYRERERERERDRGREREREREHLQR